MKKCYSCRERAIGCFPAKCPDCGTEYCSELLACPECGRSEDEEDCENDIEEIIADVHAAKKGGE